MTGIYTSAKMYLLTALVLSSSLYPRSIGEKIYDNKDKIGLAFLVVGTAATCMFGVPYCIKKYTENRIFEARARLIEHNKIDTHTYKQANDDTIKAQLVAKKEELLNKWKTNHQLGFSLSGSQIFSGRYNIANALAFYLSTDGTGVLKNCVAKTSTELSGDIIADSCQLNGNVIINTPTSFASFDNCLLGNVQYHGKAESIIELLNTVVEGSVAFDKPGIIIANDNSIISGSIINGRVIRI